MSEDRQSMSKMYGPVGADGWRMAKKVGEGSAGLWPEGFFYFIQGGPREPL